MNSEVENEITSWKFKTRLILAVAACSGFVPLMIGVVRRFSSLLSAAAESTQTGPLTTGVAELVMSVAVLAMIMAELATIVHYSIKAEAKNFAIEPADAVPAVSPRIRLRVFHARTNAIAARRRVVV